MLTSPNGMRGDTTKLNGGMFYEKNFEKICSGIEFILLYTWKCIEINGYLDFYETFCKNNDFLTCRGCNLNELVRILKWYAIFAVLLIS